MWELDQKEGEHRTTDAFELWCWRRFFFLNFILFFNFTILYWFCHISKWIHHRYVCVPHPEPSSLLRVPWTAMRSNQSILKEINPEYSLEGLMLKLKHQSFGHLMWRTDSLEQILMLGKIEGMWRKEGDRGWDSWMSSLTQWTWVWTNSGR